MKKRCTAFIYALLFIALFAGSGFLSRTVKAEPKAYDLILPDADVKVYTEEEVEDMPAQVIRYAINEIYARRGRLFASEELREYFELQPWYFGNIDPLDFTDDFLNSCEVENVALLIRVEERLYGEDAYELNQPGYSFDEVDRYISGRKTNTREQYTGIAENLIYEEDIDLILTRCLEVKLPYEWREHFGILNPSPDKLEFYCELARQDADVYNGVICCILRTESYEPEENFPNGTYLGECNDYYYYFILSDDLRCDPEDPEGMTLYKEMLEQAEEIPEDIRLIA